MNVVKTMARQVLIGGIKCEVSDVWQMADIISPSYPVIYKLPLIKSYLGGELADRLPILHRDSHHGFSSNRINIQ